MGETTTRSHIEQSVDWTENQQRDERLEGLRSGTSQFEVPLAHLPEAHQ